jgi:hypothetical protein
MPLNTWRPVYSCRERWSVHVCVMCVWVGYMDVYALCVCMHVPIRHAWRMCN